MRSVLALVVVVVACAGYGNKYDTLAPARWKAGSMVRYGERIKNGLQSSLDEIFPNDPIKDSVFFHVPTLISEAGYPVEVHHVTTEDGYILELHRIPHGKFGDRLKSSRPILLNHCLFCSSSSFIAPGPGRALGYLLADAGYDVWLMNDRGNTYSRNHTFLSPEDKKFWLFSMDEIAIYDLPTTINYVLETTHWNQIDYLGFSMGTATFVALMSERPEYNDVIRKAAFLAPVVTGHYGRGAFARFTRLGRQFEGLLRGFNATEEIPPPDLGINDILLRSCDPNNEHLEDLCETAFRSIEGSHLTGVSKQRRAQFFRSFPNRGSVRQLRHFSQIFRKGYFRHYSFGYRENMKKYGQSVPPEYDCRKTTVPIAIFWSPYDNFESYTDIKILASHLQNVQLVHRISHKNFQHTNFVWDDNVVEKLHKYVLDYLVPSEDDLDDNNEEDNFFR